jgi:predicted helicase
VTYTPSHLRSSIYRPFTKKTLYFDRTLNNRVYLFTRIFPTPESERDNRVICVSGIGGSKSFHCLMVNVIPDLHLTGDSQCFPFYTYDEDGGNRRENITDWALQEFQAQHGASVTKWDIFYYVYGVLHDPTYRTRFADNLKKDLPRIPILPNFTAYRDAGKRLATLHLEYETQPRFRDLQWEHAKDGDGKPVPVSYRVQKMKAISTEKHPDGYAIISAIQVNPTLTITNIPPEASAYRLGNRSALEWIIDQYQVKTDKRSGITSDPNGYSDDEHYIIELVERVVTVSVETVKAVAGLVRMDV